MASLPSFEHTLSSAGAEKRVFYMALAPDLRRVRHMRKIIVLNVRYDGTEPRGCGKSFARKGISDDMDILSTDLLTINHDAKHVGQTQKLMNDDLMVGLEDQIQRQLQVQEKSKCTFFDSFYSLNGFMNTDDPIYISRVFHGQPTIQEELDFTAQNQKSFTLNLMIHLDQKWCLLTEYHIKMSLLVPVGDDPELIWQRFGRQQNFLVIQLSDGCYYIMPGTKVSPSTVRELQQRYVDSVDKTNETYYSPINTCSYDQIMKLDNLQICLADLREIKKDIGAKISGALANEKSYEAIRRQILSVSTCVENLKEMLNTQKYKNYQLQKKCERQQVSKRLVSDSIESSSVLSHRTQTPKSAMSNELADYMVKLDQAMGQSDLEKARIAKDLLFTFPINPTSSKGSTSKYSFQLFGYRFPPMTSPSQLVKVLNRLTRSQMSQLNALMGYIVLIMLRLSSYLSVPFKYPVRFLGSNCYIYDPISRTQTKSRVYPLFIAQNSSLVIRFTYGLMLINKNLNQLFESENIYKVDEFNLLVNIKIFLTCLSGYDGHTDINKLAHGTIDD